jgi:nucleotide-binding universal stress UspA family protein
MNYFQNKKILVPVDFSVHSRGAVDKAIEIAGGCQNITVLHAIEAMPAYDLGARYNENIDAEHEKRVSKLLKAQFAEKQYEGLKFATTVDDPPHGITDYAEDNQFDLIVMPSHGRTGLKRLLVGSVAERVVRLSHCPVLVLRIGEESDT